MLLVLYQPHSCTDALVDPGEHYHDREGPPFFSATLFHSPAGVFLPHGTLQKHFFFYFSHHGLFARKQLRRSVTFQRLLMSGSSFVLCGTNNKESNSMMLV